MWLKALTAFSFFLGLAFLAGWPWLYRHQPHPKVAGIPANGRALVAFEAMKLGYSGMVLFSFIAAAALSMLMIRINREEYRVALTRNVKGLVAAEINLTKRDQNSPEA